MNVDINKASKQLLDTNNLSLDGDKFKIHEFEDHVNTEDKKTYYKCFLSKKGSNTVYGHAKAMPTKLEAITASLEHLVMMGYDGLY